MSGNNMNLKLVMLLKASDDIIVVGQKINKTMFIGENCLQRVLYNLGIDGDFRRYISNIEDIIKLIPKEDKNYFTEEKIQSNIDKKDMYKFYNFMSAYYCITREMEFSFLSDNDILQIINEFSLDDNYILR